MSELGENIATLRKATDMTQAELGELLSISPQAVSKWEKGISEPDTETLKKIAYIFNVSIDELLGIESRTPAPVNAGDDTWSDEGENQYETETAAAAQPAPVRQAIGFCDLCNKPLYTLNEIQRETVKKSVSSGRSMHYEMVETGRIFCPDCKKELELKDRAEKLSNNYFYEHGSYVKGWKIGGVSAGAVLLAMILFGILYCHDYLIAFVGGVFAAYAVFVTVAQGFWDDLVSDILDFFVRSFNMPGVIFSLDLDGIIWLITVKIGLAILSFLLSALVFAIGIVVVLIVGTVCFPFRVGGQAAKIHDMELESVAAKKDYIEFKESRKTKK